MKWTRLALMAVLSFIAMYILMYAMVDTYDNVFANYNQFYMAGIMTMPMLIIEIILMRSMYSHRVVIATMVLSSIGFVIFWGLLRQQIAITDEQFLKSMIPHHASALLMCKENTSIIDPEIKELCVSIVAGQQQEIDWMQTKLKQLP